MPGKLINQWKFWEKLYRWKKTPKSSSSNENAGKNSPNDKESHEKGTQQEQAGENKKDTDDVTNAGPGEAHTKFQVSTRVTVRCEVSPNYFLHGKVTKVDSLNRIYTVAFDEKDNADPKQYTEDELQKIISKPVTLQTYC